ncbi:MAG: hypothetical protein P1U41_07380 [Vicingaceae bacterium]|nr:hypothetical protein [Vicingaceae bacterium]
MKHLLSIKILTEYPMWFSFFCMLLGVIYAVVLYRKEDKLKETKSWLVKLMASARFLLVTILSFLLLSPFVKTLFNKVEKPVIIIAQDNSTSILLNKDSTFYTTEYLQKLSKLKDKLEENYEVKTYTFGEQLTEGLKVDYNQKITDLSSTFEDIMNKFYNRNVGALILASDGIFNQGANPIFNSGIEFPIYTVAMGDTSLQRDIVLKEAIHNKITFLGNQFPIEIEALAYQCEGSTTKLTVTHNGKKLFEKNYSINKDQFSIAENLLFEADKVGVQHYKIMLTTVQNEISIVNNVKDIYIEVLDGRQNILVLANAPHPDVKALKLSIENNENYKVTSQLVETFDGNVEPYSLIIVHQVASEIAAIKKILSTNVSTLFVLGNQTNINQFNQLNVGLSINNSRNKFNEVTPSFEPNFPLFTLSENTVKMMGQTTPVVASFGTYQLKQEGYVLLNQKVGSVVTDNPLMVFFQQNGKKIGVFAAEGFWRWRMQDFLQNKSHENFNELINKTVQFLSVKEDKSKFRIITKNNYFENEEILFNAELYNQSYELVNEPEIKIDLVDENDVKYSFVFNRTTTAYLLNAGILPSGFYTYNAKVKFGEKDYTEMGQFQIKPLLLEANNTVANHQLMQNISEKFGGKLFFPKEIEQIEKVVLANDNIASVIYEENDLKELINLKWIFFLLIILLGLEWFLRKRNGAY